MTARYLCIRRYSLSVASLSVLLPPEFQDLAGDLLEAQEGHRYERFTYRDRGMDLRRRENGRYHVVQIKHYADATFNDLLRDVAREREKIDDLRPRSYRLITSLPMTPGRKERLREALRPWIKHDDQILGRAWIEARLREFPKVRRAHVKLWLADAAILDEVIHRSAFQRTRALLTAIQSAMPTFVTTQSFRFARRILEKHHVCVLAGRPGIGKTTIADVLLMLAHRRKFETIQVSADIEEAWSLYEPERAQVFYYDDFLGRTDLTQRLRKNEDARLVQFIDTVRTNRRTRLIMTTREYILEQARQRSDRLKILTDQSPYVVGIPEPSRIERAQILYSHLSRSDLPRDCTLAIVKDDAYLRIVDHANWTPRLVAEMVSVSNRERMTSPPDRFIDAALELLDHPHVLWHEAFTAHLSEEERGLLIVLSTFTGLTTVEDLQLAFDCYGKARGWQFRIGAFKDSLRSLEHPFLEITRYGEDLSADLGGPAVQDFLEAYLDEHPDEVNELLRGAYFFEQVVTVWRLGQRQRKPAEVTFPRIRRAIAEHSELVRAVRRTVRRETASRMRVVRYGGLERLERSWEWLDERTRDLVTIAEHTPELVPLAQELLSERIAEWAQGEGDLVIALVALKRTERVPALRPVIGEGLTAVRRAFRDSLTEKTVDAMIHFEDEFGSRVTDSERRRWRELFREYAREELASSPTEYRIDYLESQAKRLGVDMTRALAAAREATSEGSESHDYEPDDTENRSSGGAARGRSPERELSEIRALFATLAPRSVTAEKRPREMSAAPAARPARLRSHLNASPIGSPKKRSSPTPSDGRS